MDKKTKGSIQHYVEQATHSIKNLFSTGRLTDPDLRKDPTAIERIFCRPFEELPRVLSEEVYHYRLELSLPGWPDFDLDTDTIERLQALKKRLREYLSVEIEERALVYLALVSDRFAVAIMFVTYVQYWAKQNQVEKITFELVRNRIFTHGFPSPKSLKEIWFNQKVPRKGNESDNLIDFSTAQKSIQF